MLNSRRTIRLVSLAVLLTSITACANSPTGSNLEQILAADPRQQVVFGNRNSDPTNAVLPPDFPTEIPIYQDAKLIEVTQPTSAGNSAGNEANASESRLTRWVSATPSNLVQSFYRNAFQGNNWNLSQPTDTQEGIIEARRNDLQVTVTIRPAASISNDTSTTPAPNQNADPEAVTQFEIQYVRNPATSDQVQTTPQPGDPDFIGPVLPSNLATQPQTPDTTSTALTENQSFTDLDKAPPELRQYIQDLAALGVLPLQPSATKSNQSAQFEPSKIVSRREYARWLVAANNAMYENTPAKQIRVASQTAQPAFRDVQRSDPDFGLIQGLAEAGLIPSPLSGDSTAVLFRPNAPLTREQMILWKVPIDTRQALPNASVEAVKETWGFQDVARIEPKALRAVLADFQNSDQSNIRRVFGYTTLFQPKKPVTRAEAAAALWYFGISGEGISAQEALETKTQSQPAATPETSPFNQPSSTSEPAPSASTNEESGQGSN